MNIVEDLKKEKAVRLTGAQAVVDETKLLLQENEAGEKEALRAIGLDMHIRKAESELEQTILDKAFAEKYNAEIFRFEDIQKIGERYRLFFKRANMYRGSIPPELASIVLRYKKEHNLNLYEKSDASDSGRFFILAPPSTFKDYVSPGDKVQDVFEVAKKGFKDFMKSFEDPILFFQTDDNHFAMMHKWGSDFTLVREIYGFFSATALWINTMFVAAIALLALTPVAFQLYANEHFYGSATNIIGMISLIVIGVFGIICSIICMSSSDECGTRRFSTRSHYQRAKEVSTKYARS